MLCIDAHDIHCFGIKKYYITVYHTKIVFQSVQQWPHPPIQDSSVWWYWSLSGIAHAAGPALIMQMLSGGNAQLSSACNSDSTKWLAGQSELVSWTSIWIYWKLTWLLYSVLFRNFPVVFNLTFQNWRIMTQCFARNKYVTLQIFISLLNILQLLNALSGPRNSSIVTGWCLHY